MAYRIIDMQTDPRRAHFDYFRTLAYPYAGVTQMVDVTALAEACRGRGESFFLAFLHAAALAADSVPEMRRRIRDGAVLEYDACPTSHTELLPDGSYCYCTLRHHMPYADYLAQAEAARQACRLQASIEEDEDVHSMYFVSCVPWLHYTALLQPVAGGDESNPRITWGRHEPDAQGRLMMPVTLLVHHALVDGLHMARFFAALPQEMAKLT